MYIKRIMILRYDIEELWKYFYFVENGES